MRFDWNQVRAFLATAEEGSLSAAARVLASTQPTLGRQVAALEQDLGVSLFERVGRSLVLTEAGDALLAHVREMGDAAARLSLSAAGQSDQLSGEVRISASDVFAAALMPAMLRGLHEKAPDLILHIQAENHLSDLLRREADIAVRHIEPRQPELIGRKIGMVKASFYAADRWLAEHGPPKSLEALSRLPMVSTVAPEEMRHELAQRGVEMPEFHAPFRSASGVVVWEMVKAGFGFTIMADPVAEQTPGITRFELGDQPVLEFPIWLITHRELRSSRRIRLVYDHLVEGFAAFRGG